MLTSPSSSSPRFLLRFKNPSWLVCFGVFALGVPCAILLGFAREFDLIYHSDHAEAVGCHVNLKNGFALPIISQSSPLSSSKSCLIRRTAWCGVVNAVILVFYVLRLRNATPTHRKLIKYTSCAIVVSGISTVVNLVTLIALNGEHGLECVSSL